MNASSSRPSRKSLRRTFFWAVTLTTLLTAAATFAVFYWNVTAISLKTIQQFAQSQDELAQQKIRSTVNREVVLSLKLADDPMIKDWMIHEADPVIRARARVALDSYARLFHDHAFSLAMAGTNTYYAQTPSTRGLQKTVLHPDDPHDRWFFESLRSTQPFWLNVNYDAMLHENRVWINVLVKDGGKVLGVAGAGMDLTVFLNALVGHQQPGVETIVVDDRGALLAIADRATILHNSQALSADDKIDVYSLFSQPKDKDALRLAITANKNQTLLLHSQSKTVVTTIAVLPELGWHALVIVRGDQILSWTNFLPIAAVFLASLVVVLFLVMIVLTRQVLGPLARLNRAAEALALGSFEAEVPVSSNNEIGHLSDSFNAMARQVSDTTKNLERLVQDRTRALEESQKRMVDSIQHGRLIQNSILPAQRDLDRYWTDGFVWSKPLDTVGGDFCFLHPIDDGFCIAVVDCTGHGVPGAFMTMLVSALLHPIVEAKSSEGADAILWSLDQAVRESLRAEKDMGHLKNGLDVGLCLVRTKAATVEFAGAGLPLVIHENGTWEVLPGDRIHLGFPSRGLTRDLTVHERRITLGTRLYLLTDGVLDLPVQPYGFGLGLKGWLEQMTRLASLKLGEQRTALVRALEEQQGLFAAKDDLLLVGFSPSVSREDAHD